MAPKFCPDQDGHIAPCSIMTSWKSFEEWEDFKTLDLKLRGKERKASCYCKCFDGKIPKSHICFIPKTHSKLSQFFKNLSLKLKCF